MRICSVGDCESKYYSKGTCVRHYFKARRASVVDGYPRRLVGYQGAHHRLYALRGKASNYECVQCGGSANDWALIPTASQWLYDNTKANGHKPYSLNPLDYQPMCRADHFKMDLARG